MKNILISEHILVNGTWWFQTVTKKGKEHLKIKSDSIDVAKPDVMRVNFDNLFKGNPEITKNVNNAINENIDLLYVDLKPLLETTISTVFNQYFNRFYSLYPYDVLLPTD